MEELYQIISKLKLTEQKYRILTEYIQEEVKSGYIIAEKLINFINILENKKDGKEDEEQKQNN